MSQGGVGEGLLFSVVYDGYKREAPQQERFRLKKT
jgi:hypothetical protein